MAIEQYAVMGNPIAHSLSPFIHRLFAEQTQQCMTYTALEIPIPDFEQAVLHFQSAGGKGLNVTIPFKERAYQLATQKTPRAEMAGSVNTLSFEEGKIIGDNTDGIGLVHDLLRHHILLTNKKILLIGAGGAARGVIYPLLCQQVERLHVINRTKEKAERVVKSFNVHNHLSAGGLEEILPTSFDIVIHATGCDLQKENLKLSENIFEKTQVCYDLMYGRTTFFMQCAKKAGVPEIYDGLGMLVEQASESFLRWRGVKPETASVLKAVKKQLSETVL